MRQESIINPKSCNIGMPSGRRTGGLMFLSQDYCLSSLVLTYISLVGLLPLPLNERHVPRCASA